jgi:hypothetical protein
MKNLKNASKAMGKAKAIVISFLLLGSCMQHDESLVPSNHHDDLLSNTANTELTTSNVISAEMKKVFTAHLSGGNEVPPVDLKGQGQAIFTLSDDGISLDYKLIVANTKNITQAHIHCGEPGINGPVVVFLFGFVSGGVNQNGVLAEGTITDANIIPRGSSAECMGGLATFENLLEKIRNGSAYVNVHTVDFPGGEIRGQIK